MLVVLLAVMVVQLALVVVVVLVSMLAGGDRSKEKHRRGKYIGRAMEPQQERTSLVYPYPNFFLYLYMFF
jgi:hypothetical protein